MAVDESTASCRSFGSLTPGCVSRLAGDAFKVAAHAVLSYPDDAGRLTPAEFAESVAQAFEALLACRCDRDGFPFLAEGHGQWAADRLAELPKGFRPMYHEGRDVAR